LDSGCLGDWEHDRWRQTNDQRSSSDSGQGPAEASVCLCASTLVRWVRLYTPTLELSVEVYRHAVSMPRGTLGKGRVIGAAEGSGRPLGGLSNSRVWSVRHFLGATHGDGRLEGKAASESKCEILTWALRWGRGELVSEAEDGDDEEMIPPKRWDARRGSALSENQQQKSAGHGCSRIRVPDAFKSGGREVACQWRDAKARREA
jgi:hypothetical protein